MSFANGICSLSWRKNLIISKKIENLLAKSFYLCSSLFFCCLFIYSSFNNSFWLIDNGNSGFVGERSYSFFSSFFPIIESKYFKISFLLLTLTFFVLGSSINFLKIFRFFVKNNQINDSEAIAQDELEDKIQDDVYLGQEKQQSFRFKTKNSETKTNK